MDAHTIEQTIEHCVVEFRKRLMEERRKGLLPCGYGPIVKE